MSKIPERIFEMFEQLHREIPQCKGVKRSYALSYKKYMGLSGIDTHVMKRVIVTPVEERFPAQAFDLKYGNEVNKYSSRIMDGNIREQLRL